MRSFWQQFFYRKVAGRVIAHRSRFSGTFIGSPAICRLSETHFLVSHDLFGPKSHEFERPETHIWETTDAGVHWRRISVVLGAFWSRLFIHNGALYLFGTNRHHGFLVIRRSVDGGVTWTEPKDEKTGLLRVGMFHMAPNPVVVRDGTLYIAIEFADGVVREWGKRYGSCVVSVSTEADLLDAAAWNFSPTLYYEPTYLHGCFGGWLEGSIVLGPDSTITTLLRVEDDCSFMEKAALVQFDTARNALLFNPESDFIPFPGGSKKFSVLFDSETATYVALTNTIATTDHNIYETKSDQIRNLVTLVISTDLRSWREVQVVLETSSCERTGFQYISFAFDGSDIVFVSRTAAPDLTFGARSYHDANFLTFHRIKNFRQLYT